MKLCPKQHICSTQFWGKCIDYSKPTCIVRNYINFKPNKRQMNNTLKRVKSKDFPDGHCIIEMQPINNSTRIESVGHIHHQGKNYLCIEFKKGGSYCYKDVMITHKFGILKAESPGIYFQENIINPGIKGLPFTWVLLQGIK